MEKISFGSLFSEVTKKHTTEDAENYYIIGTPQATSDLESTLQFPRPWFFARVLIMSVIAFFGFYIGAFYFQNPNFLPGLIFFGAFITPISLLIFFWEINILRNISIYKLTLFLLKGGIVALLYSVTIYSIIDGHHSPLLIGFVEETAKVLAFLLFVNHRNYHYILNGLLIGAAIGTGFAAFESSGYIFVMALKYGIPTMLETIFWRAIFAPGGHIAWAGLMGATLFLVKGDRPFRVSMLFHYKFLGMYILVIVLHALWDAPIPQPFIFNIPVLPVVLTVISWIMLFIMMKIGFREVMDDRLENADDLTAEE